MAIDFPNNPAINDLFTANGSVWTWDGTSWNLQRTPATQGIPAGGTAGQFLAKVDGTDYSTTWTSTAPSSGYTSTVKHSVKLGETTAKGHAVYVSSATGTNMIVSKASNASEATSSKTLGLTESGGLLNDTVNVITEGLLAGIDTSTAVIGNPVWLGVDGDLIYGLANKPVAPAHLVFIGVVTRVSVNNGEIFVKVQNGFELQELHNVSITNPASNQTLTYNSTTGLWSNTTISIADADVSVSANIAQSKISNLATDLSTINTAISNLSPINYDTAYTGATYGVSSLSLYKLTELTHTTEITLTIPGNLTTSEWPIGGYAEYRQMGDGRINVVATSPQTLVSADNYTKSRTKYSSIILERRGTDSWILTGDIDA